MLAWLFSLIAFFNSFIPQPTFREGIVGQPRSVSPLEVTTNQPDRDLSRFIHRGLMKYDEKGKLTTDLADSYKVSDDHKQYTFNLHRKVYWHDGKPFNADDVIETISQQHLQVVEIDKLDEYTVSIRLVKDNYAPLLDLLTQPIIPAVYKNNASKGLLGVGLGDYRVSRIKKSSKIEAVYLTLAWPWKKTENKFSRIVFYFYDSVSEAYTAAKLREIDAFGTDYKLETPQNFEVVSSPIGSRYYALFFNLENEVLKDRNFRTHLKSLISLESILKDKLINSGVISYGPLEYTFVNPRPTTPKATPKIFLKNKLDRVITITVPDSNTEKSPNVRAIQILAQEIKNSWESAGLKVEIVKIPLESVFTEIVAKKDFQILLFGQEVERDPDVYTLWHSAQINLPGLNFGSFKSALADKSLEDGRRGINPEERIVFYQRFMKVFGEEVPAIFLYHPIYNYYFRKDLTGPNLSGFYKIADRFVDFRDWKII